MVESCSTLPSLFVFADFSSSRFRSWTVFWKNDKTKRADYTKHQKSAGAWLSLQSDVLCNRLWKIKVGVLLSTAPANRTKGVVEQFGTSGVPIPCQTNPTFTKYVWTFLFNFYVRIKFHDIIILIATLIVNICTGNTCHCSCIFFMNRGGSTFCCCPLIAMQRRRAPMSTAGEARSSRPLTWAVGSAM